LVGNPWLSSDQSLTGCLSATQPSLGDVIYALWANLELLSRTVQGIESITHKLGNWESVSMVDVNKVRSVLLNSSSANGYCQVVAITGSSFAQNLEPPQKRAWAYNALERMRNVEVGKALRIMRTFHFPVHHQPLLHTLRYC
jgi:hypothetical protein